MSDFLTGTNNPYEFQSNLSRGVELYSDLRFIYNKGYKTFSKNLPSGEDSSRSNITKNIELLASENDYTNITINTNSDNNIKLFNPVLTKNIEIPDNQSGLSVKLKLNSYSISTNENTVLIL